MIAKKISFFSPVWGERYIKTFLIYTIPSAFNSGVLSFLKSFGPSEYLIYTDIGSEQKFHRLKNYFAPYDIDLKIKLFSTDQAKLRACKYALINEAVWAALRRCSEDGRPLFWIFPDQVYSKSYVETVLCAYLTGAELVYCPHGLRAHRNLFRSRLKERLSKGMNLSSGLRAGIASRVLARAGIEAWFVDDYRWLATSYANYSFAAHVYYPIEKNFLIYKGFSMSAVLYSTRGKDLMCVGTHTYPPTLDVSNVLASIYQKDSVKFITNSEGALSVGMESDISLCDLKAYSTPKHSSSKTKLSHINYFLFSALPVFYKGLSRYNRESYKYEVFIDGRDNTSPIVESLKKDLVFANERIKFWLSFHDRFPFFYRFVYFFLFRIKFYKVFL